MLVLEKKGKSRFQNKSAGSRDEKKEEQIEEYNSSKGDGKNIIVVRAMVNMMLWVGLWFL